MKVTIESYRGPNTIITTDGQVIRIPMNIAHPAVGEDFVFEKKAYIIGKASKADVAASEAAAEALEAQEKAAAKAAAEAKEVSERGEIHGKK